MNRRSTPCCTRRRNGLNRAAAASVAAATATGVCTWSRWVASRTSSAPTVAKAAMNTIPTAPSNPLPLWLVSLAGSG